MTDHGHRRMWFDIFRPVEIRRRPGCRVIHSVPPGSEVVLLNDGRAIVAGPAHAPYVVHPDGSAEPVQLQGGPSALTEP